MGYRRFHLFVHNLLLTSPSFNRIQFNFLKLVCVISSFHKAFVQFWTHSIELTLKQFLNSSAEENPCCIFFFFFLISSSSIILSLFDTHIMNCLARHKNLSLIWKVSSKCHNLINYLAKNQVVMFCFGLQSIARFINTNAPHVNSHRLESEGKFSWNFYISVGKKYKCYSPV